MLDGQKRINEDGIAFAVNERDGIGNPSEIFLSGWKTLSNASALLGQKLPLQFIHAFFGQCRTEPYTPTIAPMVPTNLLTLGQLLGYERFAKMKQRSPTSD